MIQQLEDLRSEREHTPPQCNGSTATTKHKPKHKTKDCQCVALHVSPDLGERVLLSGDRVLLEDVFPEIAGALMDARSGLSWNQGTTGHVIRFPLNGYCKMTALQGIRRLICAGFEIIACSGGGVEGQQFSEYLFSRDVTPL